MNPQTIAGLTLGMETEMKTLQELKDNLAKWWPDNQDEPDGSTYRKVSGVDKQIEMAKSDRVLIFYVQPHETKENAFSINRAFYDKTTGEFSLKKPESWD